MNAITVLMHNGNLINRAEKILQNMAKNPNCYLYLKNPDGTRIRIQPGCQIENYEYVMITKEDKNETE